MTWILKETGINFHKLDHVDNIKITEFKEIRRLKSYQDVLISSSSFYEIIVYNDLNIIDIKSSILPEIENEIQFKIRIKQIVCSEENCFFLHDDGHISSYNVMTKSLSSVGANLNDCREKIVQISRSLKSLFGVSSKNSLYQILPTFKLIHEFKSFQKVIKIQSGLEHTVLLTTNGDVYTFGCSLRGATGLGTMNSTEEVKLIEALAGIKIVDIGCSAFSTVCVSSFGDIYTFGWNTNGQLGLKKINDLCKRVYTLPELVEIEDEHITQVYCGHKHTLVRSESNKLFATGLNNYGQLGLNCENTEIDTFKEISVEKLSDKSIIICGYWKSYLINFSPCT